MRAAVYERMDELKDKPDKDTLAILLASHRQFLAFLERRLGSREIAEEVLQSAFAKAVQHEESLKEQTVVAWFYRVLRNALTDHYRRRDAETRAMDRHRDELKARADEQELERTVCECFKALMPTLKPEYSELLVAVDLGGASVADTAVGLGITPNNAAVRLHRARLALKKRLEESCKTCAVHGCYDCTCGSC
ncbi:MAG: sigma-70 family RNA polymerase sigma factor [Pirellulales bacterium]|nr:sigma-70 family RNA polymerase sigma factor [Pirellulales bacterium]